MSSKIVKPCASAQTIPIELLLLPSILMSENFKSLNSVFVAVLTNAEFLLKLLLSKTLSWYLISKLLCV